MIGTKAEIKWYKNKFQEKINFSVVKQHFTKNRRWFVISREKVTRLFYTVGRLKRQSSHDGFVSSMEYWLKIKW